MVESSRVVRISHHSKALRHTVFSAQSLQLLLLLSRFLPREELHWKDLEFWTSDFSKMYSFCIKPRQTFTYRMLVLQQYVWSFTIHLFQEGHSEQWRKRQSRMPFWQYVRLLHRRLEVRSLANDSRRQTLDGRLPLVTKRHKTRPSTAPTRSAFYRTASTIRCPDCTLRRWRRAPGGMQYHAQTAHLPFCVEKSRAWFCVNRKLHPRRAGPCAWSLAIEAAPRRGSLLLNALVLRFVNDKESSVTFCYKSRTTAAKQKRWNLKSVTMAVLLRRKDNSSCSKGLSRKSLDFYRARLSVHHSKRIFLIAAKWRGSFRHCDATRNP